MVAKDKTMLVNAGYSFIFFSEKSEPQISKESISVTKKKVKSSIQVYYYEFVFPAKWL